MKKKLLISNMLILCLLLSSCNKLGNTTTISSIEPTVPSVEESFVPTVDETPSVEPTEVPTIDVTPTIEITETPTPTESKEHTTHSFINGECYVCHVHNSDFIDSIFGEDTEIYDEESGNPYDIDLSTYGSDVYAVIYEPTIDDSNDPYKSINSTSFYNNDYERAITYEDAYFRTKHNLLSGDITDQSHLPPDEGIKENNQYIRSTTALYILNTDGDYLGYVINSNQYQEIIYYGAAYQYLNDVAAYLLAFGEVPVNSNYDKGSSGQKAAISAWGKYGRVNIGEFSGNISKYPYEPELPTNNKVRYVETDFGTLGGYINQNTITGTYYNQKAYYNNGKISRGAARFCFVSDSSIKSIDDRYVFYTYNHYNDFQEYLNYNNAWGERFGNITAGNQYCGDSDDYYETNEYSITQYVEPLRKEYSELNII